MIMDFAKFNREVHQLLLEKTYYNLDEFCNDTNLIINCRSELEYYRSPAFLLNKIVIYYLPHFFLCNLL